MKEFLLDDLTDLRRFETFEAWAAERVRHGERRLTVRIRGTSANTERGLLWHDRLASCNPVPITTVLEGAVWVPELLAWLSGVRLEIEKGATVWFGGHDLFAYSKLWHDARDLIASRILRTAYQENRGYPLRAAIDLLCSSRIVGARELTALHGTVARPDLPAPAEIQEPKACPDS